MALQTPTWLQAGTYSAKEDRAMVDGFFGAEGVINVPAGGFAVTQRAAGANNSVDVASGLCVIQGDDESEQGKYLVRNVGSTNVALTAAPVSNSRYDLVYVRVNDATAGGPAGDNAAFGVLAGTAAASPTVPTTPTSAIALATVLRTAGDTSVTTAMITDVRTDARFSQVEFQGARLASVREPFTVSATAATGTVNLNVLTSASLMYTTNASANWTLNIRGSASAALTTVVAIGESITVTFAAQQGATAYYQSATQIDGGAVTVKWQDAVAPTAGVPSTIDAYTLTIIRTGVSTWTVLGSRVVFA